MSLWRLRQGLSAISRLSAVTQSVVPFTSLAAPKALRLPSASWDQLLQLERSRGLFRPYSSTAVPHARNQTSAAGPAEQALHDAAVSAIAAVESTATSLESTEIVRPGGRKDRQIALLDWNGQTAGTTQLPGSVFDCEVRRDIMHRVVRWQLAKKQQGTHKAKTRREVRGGGRKPHNQKGTGRARAGTIRAPQWRGGGKAHGPVPRSHEHSLNRKVRQMGIRCALSAKAAEGRLILMQDMALGSPKTRELNSALNVVLSGAPRRSVLLVDSGARAKDGGRNLRLASGNLPWVDVLPVEGANVYSILQRDYLMLSAAAIPALVDRATRPIRRRRLEAGGPPISRP